MKSSLKVVLTYAAMATALVVASAFLEFQAYYNWQPQEATSLEPQIRLLVLLPLWTAGILFQALLDPLLWRVMRMLRFKEHQSKHAC